MHGRVPVSYLLDTHVPIYLGDGDVDMPLPTCFRVDSKDCFGVKTSQVSRSLRIPELDIYL